MAIQTFKIELRIDMNDPERIKAIHEHVVMMAKELYAVTGLLKEFSKPIVNVSKAGFFQKEEIVDISGE